MRNGKSVEMSRVKQLIPILGVAVVLFLNIVCIAWLLRDDSTVEEGNNAETSTESETESGVSESSSVSETEVDSDQVIREERKLSEKTLQLATEKLDEYYTNLRGFYYLTENRTFQVYWDVDWEKYVVTVEKRGDAVNVILNVNSETSVSVDDADEQIGNGNYATGGKMVLLHESKFTMEPTVLDEREQFRYIGGYLLRMISGVGVERSEGKPYGVKAFLPDCNYNSYLTKADVYYGCGYRGAANQLTWDSGFNAQSQFYVDEMRIFSTGELRAWKGDFNQLKSDNCDLFLEGILEETVGPAGGYEFIDWGPLLHAAWMLYQDGRETTEGVMKGDIYLSDIGGTFYRGWICFDGDEPIKVSTKNENTLAKSLYIFEDAVFSDAETEAALSKLSFELTIGTNWTTDG